jgi:hypothetical protein
MLQGDTVLLNSLLTFHRFYVKWKDYLEEKASWKKKLISERTILILSLRTMTVDGRGGM